MRLFFELAGLYFAVAGVISWIENRYFRGIIKRLLETPVEHTPGLIRLKHVRRYHYAMATTSLTESAARRLCERVQLDPDELVCGDGYE